MAIPYNTDGAQKRREKVRPEGFLPFPGEPFLKLPDRCLGTGRAFLLRLPPGFSIKACQRPF